MGCEHNQNSSSWVVAAKPPGFLPLRPPPKTTTLSMVVAVHTAVLSSLPSFRVCCTSVLHCCLTFPGFSAPGWLHLDGRNSGRGVAVEQLASKSIKEVLSEPEGQRLAQVTDRHACLLYCRQAQTNLFGFSQFSVVPNVACNLWARHGWCWTCKLGRCEEG